MSIPSEKLDYIEKDLGLVSPQKLTIFNDQKFKTESGAGLGPIDIAYETYGNLNEKRDNVILIAHHLTADAHVAGKHTVDDESSGWWDTLIGPNKVIDTNQYYVICINVLGSCYGTTGPASINPETGREYGTDFPVITIGDMVRLQKAFLKELEINELYAVIGGSMGGMQALKWAVEYPEFVQKVVPIGTPGRLKAQSIAYNQIGIEAIKNDPAWQNGHYYNTGSQPKKGMALARKIGMITFRSPQSFQERFGREEVENQEFYTLDNQFEINNYLDYHGDKFIDRFDANSFIYLTKAMDLYDLGRGYESFNAALNRVKAEVLIITISSDQLFPPEETLEVVKGLNEVGGNVEYQVINSDFGHDAFLVEFDKLKPLIGKFLYN
ncbi:MULTISPECIES: homoserine O-acetyltransferase MetX [unclassified Candidatus Frackibacter]|uniref:homoserine O-acetyltransferase MetX n=1 Tax=unclassified Candidatus Frackibacter TaxID=2648818 RepID=UPI00087ECCFC|nr:MULTISPECIES: homoserine O-acetyltransferase [unclassified Candidatus Frackibacter]SDC26098.1 homoserine O-acetyltransferase [Candidatus Frackibacter sp. WG11]SEM53091.1 homoserine O-acetyltransferase [Candidatus Frackibacter sp. WG12]SFL55393.1 homoserine O-acetyltransferase [Candidatus Frackibacter sp. WG13]